MVAASCPSQSLPCGVNRRSVPGGTRVPRKLPPEDLLKQERVQPRPLPIQKLAVPSSGHGLDEATPVQSPEKYPPVAESSSLVRFAPSTNAPLAISRVSQLLAVFAFLFVFIDRG